MPACRMIGVLALVAWVAAWTDPPAEPPAGPRVVVLLGGDQDARGYLSYESDQSVELHDLAGKVRSYPRSRVLKVVRLIDAAPGQRGAVLLRDGTRRDGILIEDGFDKVVLEIDGIQTRFARETVDSVVLLPGFDEVYAHYRDAARTAPQRLELCRWLIQEHRYDLAKNELEALDASDPSPDVTQLLRLVQAQLDLAPPPGAAAHDDADSGDQAERGDEPAGPGPIRPRLLTREEVNLIRVYEVDLNRPPRMTIDSQTIRTMVERYAASPAIPATEAERRKLYRAEPKEILALMFRLRARELYPQVQVLSEPWSLNLFRERVHNTWLVNTCATTACHGGSDAGRFYLNRRRYRDERVRYTNLLILDRLQIDPQWPLVNYEDPMMSVIIQYGLPRQEARLAHPQVKGWQPVFDRSGQRMLRDAVNWIESMMRPRPQYPIDFDPVLPTAPGSVPPAPTEAAAPAETPGTSPKPPEPAPR